MSGSKKRKSGVSSIRSSVVTTLTKSDLPPDVRDRAIFEAREVLFSWIEGRSIDPELAPAIVVAVVVVVGPEIERPLQARIEELEAEVARRKRSGEALNTECEQIGEKADEAWRALNPYMARVELLTAALTEIGDSVCCGVWTGVAVTNCADSGREDLCPVCTARAALAAGVTESEIEIDSGDLRVSHYDPPDATELSGAMRGVTITHIPTGIAFSHHSERSQLQNKARCYEDLKRRLAELAPSERAGVTESEAP